MEVPGENGFVIINFGGHVFNNQNNNIKLVCIYIYHSLKSKRLLQSMHPQYKHPFPLLKVYHAMKKIKNLKFRNLERNNGLP